MKKLIALITIAALSCHVASFASEEQYATDITKANAAALTTALMSIAGELLTDLPGIIKDIAKFPGAVQSDVKALQKGMQAAAALTGQAKQKKVEELFVYGVNLTILLSNILNKFMVIIAKIGPVAEAIDNDDGHKIDEALKVALTIMQMISKINIAMKNAIVAQGTTTINPNAKPTPTLDPIPDL
jgi:hypothetical protein